MPPPAGDIADNTKQAKETAPPYLVYKQGDNENERKQKPHPGTTTNTLQVTAAVARGTGIQHRQVLPTSLLVGLVRCYPVWRLLPAFVERAPPPKRMRQLIHH